MYYNISVQLGTCISNDLSEIMCNICSIFSRGILDYKIYLLLLCKCYY